MGMISSSGRSTLDQQPGVAKGSVLPSQDAHSPTPAGEVVGLPSSGTIGPFRLDMSDMADEGPPRTGTKSS